MPDKITDEMRGKLREPLPPEAVSQHPTKKYLSSIKSIYVVERINEVFGLGSWTLKSEVIERVDYQRENKDKVLKDVRFVVIKTILEIPGYGFYGESYGGNDNEDIGDAYKGATTDGLTKIAAQQLEIGIDVFKGIKDPPRPATKSTTAPVKEKSSSNPPKPPPEKAEGDDGIPKTTEELFAWVAEMMKWKDSKPARSWLVNKVKIEEAKIDSDPEGCYREAKALMGW